MTKGYKNYLDELITNAVQEIVEESKQNIDVEKCWQDFEQRLIKRQKGRKFWSTIRILAAAAVMVFAVIAFSAPQQVNAVKTEVFEWLYKSNDGRTIISEKANFEVKPGEYKKLTFEEAQAKVVFQLKYPNYLPEGIKDEPTVNVRLDLSSLAAVTMSFPGDNKAIIVKQENLGGKEERNTFIPSNANVESFNLSSAKVTIIKNETNFKATWLENSIRYTILTQGITNQELIKVIKGLN